MSPFDFSDIQFSPVIDLPENYEVFDLTAGRKQISSSSSYGIGKYNEIRPQMYTSELYSDQRNIHMGIDIMAPIQTPIKAFYDGEIFLFANNNRDQDYGYTIITKHIVKGQELYALFGHLNSRSHKGIFIGQKIKQGEVFAWVGDRAENGGWPAHLHLQLSIEEPKVCDMPGVVHERDLDSSLRMYPDPQIILGKLY